MRYEENNQKNMNHNIIEQSINFPFYVCHHYYNGTKFLNYKTKINKIAIH